MSDDLVNRGYADGKYICSCRKCGGWFMGDKRAWCCKGCAMSSARIKELEAKLKTVVEDKVDVVVKLTKLQTYLEDFFILLDKTEETDEGRVFRPNHISSCRVQDGHMLDNLLLLMKATLEDRQK